MKQSIQIETPRLRLRQWESRDADAFAKLNSHPEVMADLGGPLDRDASDKKLERYTQAFEDRGYSRWAIENHGGDFLGYAGIMHIGGDHPLGAHDDIGWRLCRHAWGFGYATEAARAALDDGFERLGLTNIITYTAPENTRSQAVMERMKLRRVPSLDFSHEYEPGENWKGWVWVTPQATKQK